MKFPSPLENRHWWNPGAWLLPAASLSLASAITFVITFVFIAYPLDGVGNLSRIFKLPLGFLPTEIYEKSLIGIALFVLAFSVLILVKTAPRPSRLIIKLWVLLLVIINLTVVAIAFLETQPSWWSSEECKTCWKWSAFQHTSVLASFIATSVLSLRLLKPRVDSKIIQFITPTALLIVLFLAPLSIYKLIGYANEQFVDQLISTEKHLKNEVDKTKNLFSRSSYGIFTEQELEEKSTELQTLLERADLSSINEALNNSGDYPELKQSSKKIKKHFEEIFENLNQLTNASNFPTLSDYEKPPFRYVEKKWIKDKETEAYNLAVARYYTNLNQYLEKRYNELEKSPLKNKDDLIQQFQTTMDSIKESLEPKLNNWMDRWIVYQLPIVFNKNYTKDAFISDLIDIKVFNEAKFSEIKSVIGKKGYGSELAKILNGKDFNSKNCFHEPKSSVFRCYAYNGNEKNVEVILEFRAIKGDKKIRYFELSIPQANDQLSINTKMLINSITNSNLGCISRLVDQSSVKDFGEGRNARRIRLESKNLNKGSCND